MFAASGLSIIILPGVGVLLIGMLFEFPAGAHADKIKVSPTTANISILFIIVPLES